VTFPHEEEKKKKWTVRKATEYWIQVEAETEEEAISKAEAAKAEDWAETDSPLEAEED
jgi:hypothetical protein